MEDKILIKNLRQLKGYTATRFLREFKTKNWTKGCLKTLLEKTDRPGSIDCVTGSGRPALPILLATSLLSASGVDILALVSGHTEQTSSINSDNFEMNGAYTNL